MTDDFFHGEWEHVESRTNVEGVDVDASVTVEGFAVGADPSDGGAGSTTGPSPSRPSQPTAPSTPGVGLGFPENNEVFMQSLEIRGKNGHDEPVETVYALAVTEGARPRLVALDDPEMYVGATRSSVRYFVDPMADEVARQCGGDVPDAVVKVHTHPSGSTDPSDTDKQGTETTREAFQEALGSPGFDFLQGIHAYEPAQVSPADMRDPLAAGNSVSWHGERYRHTLALYDGHFRNARDVRVV